MTSFGGADAPVAPSDRRSLASNVFATLGGNVVYVGCQWGELVVLARLVGPEGVGTFALALAITAPIVLFSNLSLRTVLATDARGEIDFDACLRLRRKTSALAFGAIVVTALAAGYRGVTLAAILLVGLAKGFEASGDLVHGLFQRTERMDLVGRSLVWKGIAGFVAFGATALATHDLLLAIAALAIAWGAVLWLFDLPNARRISREAPRPERAPETAVLVRRALPLSVATTLASLNVNIPRTVLERSRGPAELGLYAATEYLIVAAGLVVNSVGQSALQRLASLHADGDREGFFRLLGRLCAFGAAFGAAGIAAAIFVGRPVLALLYGEEFGANAALLRWVALGAPFSFVATYLGYALTSTRKFEALWPRHLAVTAITTASALWLIPRYGAVGAAWTSLASSLAMAAAFALALAPMLRARHRAP